MIAPHVLEAAERTLTKPQYEAWSMHVRGIGTRAISVHLEISRSAVLDRLTSAGNRLRKAGIYEDASGIWHVLPRKEAA